MEPILEASFITSSADIIQCPKPEMPEYAFFGRSNVGKSSLINTLAGRKMLAKISASPGKTRLINHFLINQEWYLVDLPGYGYAKVGQGTRRKWEKVVENYLLKRPSLMSTFILVDSRLSLQDNDRRVISWFGENRLPFVIVMTKTDKLGKVQLIQQQKSFREELMTDWEELPPLVLFSSKTGVGRSEILDYISDANRLFRQP